MNDYFIECSIGGTALVKVTAESLDKALELSALMTIDDWENAGSLKIGDVEQRLIDTGLAEFTGVEPTHEIEQSGDWYTEKEDA